MFMLSIALLLVLIFAVREETPTVGEAARVKIVQKMFAPGTLERTIFETSATLDITREINQKVEMKPTILTFDMDEADVVTKGLQSFIQRIVFINLDTSTDRRVQIEEEIATFNCMVPVYRLNAVRRENGAIGCFLSHISALSHAIEAKENVLVLEDDFVFTQKREIILQQLQEAESVLRDRWDCIVFGQYPHEWQPIDGTEHAFRILDSTTTSGYLVHKDYVFKLFTYFVNEFRKILGISFKDNFHIDQIQRKIQRDDFWVGFRESLGGQRPGHSIIGNTYAANSWTAADDLKSFVNGAGDKFPLKTLAPFKRKRIAICNIATGKYDKYVLPLHVDMHNNFLRGHELGFFLFTDSDKFGSLTASGDMLYVYPIEHKAWPYATLLRYHHMLLAKTVLLTYDYMIYVDADYRVFGTAPESDIFVDGLFAVRHLHELTGNHLNEAHHLFGSPDTNPASKACINVNESMVAYVCGGCQGGRTADYLKACEVMKEWIDIDLSKGVMPKWHDESMWNRYIVSNPPAKFLSQSYIFPEECLDKKSSNICSKLYSHNITPIMLPIKKNHSEMRNP